MTHDEAPRRRFPYVTALYPTRLTVAPTAWVAPTAVLRGEVEIGARSSVWYQAVLRGDLAPVRIGEDTNVQDASLLHVEADGPVCLGHRVTVGHMAIVHAATVDDDCLIAMGAKVLSGARIGAGSIIGAGAIVTEGTRIPERSLVLGVPGRIVRRVTDEEYERIGHNWRVYVSYAAHHRDEQAREAARRGDAR